MFSFFIASTFTSTIFANEYTDVPKNHWAYDTINKATESGLVNGFDDGSFGLQKTIKRSEFTSMLVRMMNWENSSNPSAFSDVV